MARQAAGRKSGGNGGRTVSAGKNNAPQKRHQRQRGHPDPDAKIIALTPKALMDGKCFVCNLCTKRFAREQNLILHTRRHHVPAKLKKSTDGSPRKTAYVCPVVTCRHHNPKRALSDITGIKKHFGRAHCMKNLACTRCNKKYAIEADLKAHVKLHHKDMDTGAGSSDWSVRAEQVWNEELEELDSDSDISEDEDTAAAAAGNDNDGSSDNNVIGDITQLSLGITEQQDVYVPQFDIATDQEEERDLELLGSLPMGLTGLLAGCTTPGNPEAPAAAAAAANSIPDLVGLFAPAATMPTAASAGGLGGVMSPREPAVPTVDLSLSFSPYGVHDHQGNNNAVNNGAGMLESLSFPSSGVQYDSNAVNHCAGMLERLSLPAYEEQYGKTDAPASGQELPAAELAQMTGMIEPNTSVTTPAVLPNAAAFQMPPLVMIPAIGNFYYPAGVLSQQAMSTPNPPLSFAPFFGGATLGNANNHTMAGGSSDGFAGFFMGSANLNQGRELGANGVLPGGFLLGIPAVCAPQYQSPNLIHDNLPAHGLSYASILSGGTVGAPAAAAGRQMEQPWVGMEMAYEAPPPAAPELANLMPGNGTGGEQGIDLFGASGEGPSRWFDQLGSFNPTATTSGVPDASLRYSGLQGGNPGGFW